MAPEYCIISSPGLLEFENTMVLGDPAKNLSKFNRKVMLGK